MKTFRGVILGICVAISISVFAASLWPNGPWLETFQNGFLFGNGSVFSTLNSVPKFDDRRLDDRNKDYYFQEDFEGGTVSFTCGANLTATDETGSPIAGSTSKLITQAAGAQNQICESPTIVLDEKQKDSLNQVCINAVGENFDLIAYDSTNSNELGRISIEDTSKTYCLEFLTIASTDEITYRLEAVNEVVSSTLKYDDVQFKTNPLNAAQVFASTEWEAYSPTITGFGTTSSEDFKYRRLGDTIEVEGYFVSGSSTATEAQITLPNGYTIKQGALQNVGTWARDFSGSSELGGFVLATSGDSFINLGDRGTFASSGTNPDPVDAAVGSRVVVSGNGVSLKYSVSVNELSNTFKSIVTNSGEAETEHYGISSITMDFWDSTGIIETFDTSLLPLTDSNFIEYNDTTETRIVAKQDIILSYSASGRNNDNTAIFALKNNASGTNLEYLNWQYAQGSNEWNSVSGEVKLNAGEYIYFQRSVASSREGGIRISARKATLGEYHLVPVSDQENVFSAKITNNGTASIESQSNSWIDSVSRTTSGTVVINFKSGIFTQAPSITVVSEQATNDSTERVTAISASSATIVTRDTTLTQLVDLDFNLIAQKQGADYKEPKVFLGNFGQPACIIKDVKASSVSGGDFNSGSWITRELNTIEGTCSFLSISLNEITLDKGSYIIEGFAPAHAVNAHQTRIYNVSDAAAIFYGGSMFAFATNSVTNTSNFYGKVTLNSSKTLRVEHQAVTTKTGDGLGVGNSFGGDNIFTTVKITKVR